MTLLKSVLEKQNYIRYSTALVFPNQGYAEIFANQLTHSVFLEPFAFAHSITRSSVQL